MSQSLGRLWYRELITALSALQPSPARLRLHVEELLAEHLVSVDYYLDARPLSDLSRRHVVVYPVLGYESYLVALGQIAAVIGEADDVPAARDERVRSWMAEQGL
jgi:hypothetical protein